MKRMLPALLSLVACVCYVSALAGESYNMVDLPVLMKSNAADPDDVNWDDQFGGTDGVNGTILAITSDGTNIYIGGNFSLVGGVSVANIAKWNGTTWSALGTGTSGQVNVIAINGSDVYAGGSFTTAGGNTVNNIAKWNGSTWSDLDTGISGGDVRAIAVSGSDIFVGGGDFTEVGSSSTSANSLAKWNGTSWSALGSGLNAFAWVYSIAVEGNMVYVGGSFTTAGGSSVNNIAVWNNQNSTWSALSDGLDGNVNGLTTVGSDIYAGGDFTKSGTTDMKKAAKWNGSSWTQLGTGIVGSTILGVESYGSSVFFGGVFTGAGAATTSNIAKWSGSAWSNLGSGTNNAVMAIGSTIAGQIYAGGVFTQAGAKDSNRFGCWDEGAATPVELASFRAHLDKTSVTLQWTTVSESNNYGFEIERRILSADLTKDWETRGFVQGAGNSQEVNVYSYFDDIRDIDASTSGIEYRLKQIDLDGTYQIHQSVSITPAVVPQTHVILNQNYPNPFNPETTIEFTIPVQSRALIQIYNVTGQLMQTLVDDELNAGTHTVRFDAGSLPAGPYFYTIRTSEPQVTKTRQMMLVK